mmetsp:Transcript_65203/g.206008  ORF Transcript_65203/g.206008 Transcript_65203/m.206008 type:complete len:294 (-) Transcript_65203:229-1110(-)
MFGLLRRRLRGAHGRAPPGGRPSVGPLLPSHRPGDALLLALPHAAPEALACSSISQQASAACGSPAASAARGHAILCGPAAICGAVGANPQRYPAGELAPVTAVLRLGLHALGVTRCACCQGPAGTHDRRCDSGPRGPRPQVHAKRASEVPWGRCGAGSGSRGGRAGEQCERIAGGRTADQPARQQREGQDRGAGSLQGRGGRHLRAPAPRRPAPRGLGPGPGAPHSLPGALSAGLADAGHDSPEGGDRRRRRRGGGEGAGRRHQRARGTEALGRMRRGPGAGEPDLLPARHP